MTRQRISLDGAWDFWRDPQAQLRIDNLPETGRRQVRVPAPWQPQLDEAERMDFGVGWYRRTFLLPQDLGPGVWVLHVGAADYHTDVWVNGQSLGQHEGGYLPFELDITATARPGDNTIHLRVADLAEDFDDAPHGKQSWYGPLSGVWQPVWLEQRAATHLLRVQITPSGDQVDVVAHYNRAPRAGQPLAYRVTDPGGELVAADELETRAAGTTQAFAFRVPDPLLWSPEQPNLYRLEVQLEGQPGDRWEGTFGFRTIEARAGRLYLNGRPLMLRGALDQDYYPHLVYTLPSEEMLADQLRQAKAMGLNCLRVHIKIADPRYYQMADELGLLIWTELPNWKRLTEAAKRRAAETLQGMLERDWNHPSIIIWTIINENWGANLTHDPEHRAWLADTYAWLKERDPLRLVVDNSACFSNFHVVTDIEDFHNYYAIPDHYQSWRDWAAVFANRAPWTFNPLFADAEDWQRYLRSPWESLERPPAPEVRRKGDEPLIVSEFGNWGLPDLDRLRACYGGNDPWWFETGYEWDEGVVYPHGIERRFFDFGLHTVFGSLADLTCASQWYQFHAMKYEIEQMRRHESISGYVITEFTDLHWECNGLLDMCRNPKAYHDRLPEINADDMLIPEWRRLAFWPGETAAIEVLLSHYSSLDLSGSRLRWRLEGEGGAGGELGPLEPAPYRVTPLGQVAFTVPPAPRSRADRLVFELVDGQGRVAARGSQQVYFLPRPDFGGLNGRVWAPDLAGLEQIGLAPVQRLADGRVAVGYDLTADLYEFARAGGQVLWLAEREAPQSAFLSQPYVRERQGTPLQGDWASSFSWIRPGAVFPDLPTAGPVDFAFADLTPNNFIAGMLPVDFARRVHAGIFAGWLQKNAALVAEIPVGRGRVLACTFRLGERAGDHPVAAAMLSQMLGYLAQ